MISVSSIRRHSNIIYFLAHVIGAASCIYLYYCMSSFRVRIDIPDQETLIRYIIIALAILLSYLTVSVIYPITRVTLIVSAVYKLLRCAIDMVRIAHQEHVRIGGLTINKIHSLEQIRLHLQSRLSGYGPWARMSQEEMDSVLQECDTIALADERIELHLQRMRDYWASISPEHVDPLQIISEVAAWLWECKYSILGVGLISLCSLVILSLVLDIGDEEIAFAKDMDVQYIRVRGITDRFDMVYRRSNEIIKTIDPSNNLEYNDVFWHIVNNPKFDLILDLFIALVTEEKSSSPPLSTVSKQS